MAAQVDWCVNASFDELRLLLGDAVAGLHTMVDEHFGISVVEYMAAGGCSRRGAGTWRRVAAGLRLQAWAAHTSHVARACMGGAQRW